MLALSAFACGAWSRAAADGWVGALPPLRPAPADLTDARSPLAERLALARALGAFGPEDDAVQALLAGLAAKPELALRDAILLALARRAPSAAAGPLATELAAGEDPTPTLALALGEIGSRSALAALVDALGRSEAAFGVERALLRAGAHAARPLAKALRGHSGTRAARLLGRLGPFAGAAAIPALERALLAPGPELRAAAAIALGRLRARGSAPALLARLSDPLPAVVSAALFALAEVAGEEHGPRLLGFFARAPLSQRAPALRALARAAPRLAAAPLARALAGGDAALRAQAIATLETGAAPSVWFVSSLTELFRAELREATASALARVPDGGGLPALLLQGERSPDAAQRAARAIALGLRSHADDLSGDDRERAQALLRSLGDGARGLSLRALARDAQVAPAIARALAHDAGELRAAAALAAAWLGVEDAPRAALRAALLRERDVEAARCLLRAAASLGERVPLDRLRPWLELDDTAPEALELVQIDPAAGDDPELAAYLRRALSSRRPARVRAAAALALGALGDRSVLPPLVAALADGSGQVRLAALRALGRLGGPAAVFEARAHARGERDLRVRAAALEVAAAAGEPVAPARGAAVLEVRVAGPGDDAAARPLVDVLLDDGRWLRQRTLAGGELILADLPPGAADVRRED